MKPLREAQEEVLDGLPRLPAESVPVGSASGLVLAETVAAPHDVPPFTNSAMDGFAVRVSDIAVVPVELTILEDVAAGSVARTTVTPGTTVKIMTGAPMPAGADTVVKVEDTTSSDRVVRILVAPEQGSAVRAAGGDLRRGETVFDVGTRLGPAHLAVLASLGVSPVVGRRPQVAIFSTGDEVLPPDAEVLSPGKIRDANRPLLAALIERLGAEVVDLGILPDDPAVVGEAIEEAARSADVVVTSGGVSMGEYDVVKQVLSDLGSVEFWKVAMQPGKPVAFGTVLGTPFFGLPGNPVSVFVSFEQLLRPGLLQMMGSTRLYRPRVLGTFVDSISTDPHKVVFVRAAASPSVDSRWEARRSGGQQSNALSALAAANAFVVSPVGTERIDPGQAVTLEMFEWPETRTRAEALDE